MIKSIRILFIMAVVTLMLFTFPNSAGAQFGIIPFGGRILFIIPPDPFTCWFIRLVIGPPKPITAAVVPGITRIYQWATFRPGNWTLGIAGPPMFGLCTSPIILKIGTSLIP